MKYRYSGAGLVSGLLLVSSFYSCSESSSDRGKSHKSKSDESSAEDPTDAAIKDGFNLVVGQKQVETKKASDSDVGSVGRIYFDLMRDRQALTGVSVTLIGLKKDKSGTAKDVSAPIKEDRLRTRVLKNTNYATILLTPKVLQKYDSLLLEIKINDRDTVAGPIVVGKDLNGLDIAVHIDIPGNPPDMPTQCLENYGAFMQSGATPENVPPGLGFGGQCPPFFGRGPGSPVAGPVPQQPIPKADPKEIKIDYKLLEKDVSKDAQKNMFYGRRTDAIQIQVQKSPHDQTWRFLTVDSKLTPSYVSKALDEVYKAAILPSALTVTCEKSKSACVADFVTTL